MASHRLYPNKAVSCRFRIDHFVDFVIGYHAKFDSSVHYGCA